MFLRGLEIMYRLFRGTDPYPHAANTLLEAEGGAALDLEHVKTDPDPLKPERDNREEDGR
jgi:hypothetical protein